MQARRLEKQIMAMELANYMYYERRTYKQAFEEKMLSTKKTSCKKLYWAIKKITLKSMTKKYVKKIVIMNMF